MTHLNSSISESPLNQCGFFFNASLMEFILFHVMIKNRLLWVSGIKFVLKTCIGYYTIGLLLWYKICVGEYGNMFSRGNVVK